MDVGRTGSLYRKSGARNKRRRHGGSAPRPFLPVLSLVFPAQRLSYSGCKTITKTKTKTKHQSPKENPNKVKVSLTTMSSVKFLVSHSSVAFERRPVGTDQKIAALGGTTPKGR